MKPLTQISCIKRTVRGSSGVSAERVLLNDSVEKANIMKARTGYSKLFCKLVNKQRSNIRNSVDDLYDDGTCYSGPGNVLEVVRRHFPDLAKALENKNVDSVYHAQVQIEIDMLPM